VETCLFAEPLVNCGCCIVACFQGRCLAMGLRVILCYIRFLWAQGQVVVFVVVALACASNVVLSYLLLFLLGARGSVVVCMYVCKGWAINRAPHCDHQ
jgi:hypothetical protein